MLHLALGLGWGPLHTVEGGWVGDHFTQEGVCLQVPELQRLVLDLYHQVMPEREREGEREIGGAILLRDLLVIRDFDAVYW